MRMPRHGTQLSGSLLLMGLPDSRIKGAGCAGVCCECVWRVVKTGWRREEEEEEEEEEEVEEEEEEEERREGDVEGEIMANLLIDVSDVHDCNRRDPCTSPKKCPHRIGAQRCTKTSTRTPRKLEGGQGGQSRSCPCRSPPHKFQVQFSRISLC